MPERFEHTTLHGPGSIPGIPGTHGPGPVVIDWQERRILSVEEWNKLTLPKSLVEAQAKTAKSKATKGEA